MAAIIELDWPGKGGRIYEFKGYELTQGFKHLKGNYIFAYEEDGKWYAVYIGEGWLDERASSDNEHWDCIERKGATMVFVRVDSDEDSRLTVEQDLLRANPEAYAPIGCNKKAGG